MKHGKKINHLGRTSAHRKSMLSNMASSLIKHKRINTTLAKAKALRKYVEPLLTKSKTDSTHSRRVVFSYLQDKEAARILFDEVAAKIGDRPGGYTRIIRTGKRTGDNAEMCLMEIVDFNELMLESSAESKSRTRRSGRRRKSKSSDSAETADPSVAVAEAEESETQEEPEASTKEKAQESNQETPSEEEEEKDKGEDEKKD